MLVKRVTIETKKTKFLHILRNVASRYRYWYTVIVLGYAGVATWSLPGSCLPVSGTSRQEYRIYIVENFCCVTTVANLRQPYATSRYYVSSSFRQTITIYGVHLIVNEYEFYTNFVHGYYLSCRMYFTRVKDVVDVLKCS